LTSADESCWRMTMWHKLKHQVIFTPCFRQGVLNTMGGDLAPSLGGTPKKFCGLFRKKFPFSRRKILMTFFSHWPGFSNFDSLFSDSLCLYCIKCHIWPFLHNKKPSFNNKIPWRHLFFLPSSFCAHPTTLLLKILGMTNAWAVPPPQILGGPSPPLLNTSTFQCFISCKPLICSMFIV